VRPINRVKINVLNEIISQMATGNKPSLLIRFSAVMFFLLMIGHMSAYPWATTDTPEEFQLISSMKTHDFVFTGEHASYWKIYSAGDCWSQRFF
jgi:hypothetical protein